MVLITRNDVPVYLQNGAFFTSLDEDDQIEFEVPYDCFKRNDQIHSAPDLYHLLKTTSFWGVDNVAALIAPFMFHNSLQSTFLNELHVSFPEYQRILSSFDMVKKSEPNRVIVQTIYSGFGTSVVKFLYQNEGFVLNSDACTAAVVMKDLPLLSYLHERNCPWDTRTIANAIFHRNAEALHYACANGCPLPDDAMSRAAATGDVDVMTLLHRFGVPYPEVLYLRLYNITSIHHLRSMGCDWNTSNCKHYAQVGKLECLVYAHENGCPWDEKVCAAAARYGRLPCLQYAHEQDCPWDEQTMMDAAQFGELDCLKYAQEHDCPVNVFVPNQACAHCHWRCLAYLLWHLPLGATFAVYVLVLYAFLFVGGVTVVIMKGQKRIANDYAQLGSISLWLMRFLLLIYGPRCLSGNFTLQLKLHLVLLVMIFVVMWIVVITGPLVAMLL